MNMTTVSWRSAHHSTPPKISSISCTAMSKKMMKMMMMKKMMVMMMMLSLCMQMRMYHPTFCT